jgi:translation initiation factor 1
MSRKIPTSAPQQPLQSPFSTLSKAGLPEGPEGSLASKRKEKLRVVLRRETAQRGGKIVVVISQIPTHLSPPEIKQLSRAVRQSLGCGGCVRGREIEVQGDQAERVRCYFEALGYEVVGP